MPQKNIILDSLKESFTLIYKNKSYFTLLFALQILFFIIFSIISGIYVPKILESSKAMSDYIANQKFDEVSLTQNILQQKNILGDDPLSISRNFNDMIKNFRILLAYTFIILIFFMSVNWTITHKLVYKGQLKKPLKDFFKIFSILFFYLGLVFLFFFSLLDISLTEAAMQGTKLFGKYLVFLLISIVLFYFMFISISLLGKAALKDVVQKTLIMGIRKLRYILAVYLMNIILFGILIFLFIYFIEISFFIVVLAMILFVFSFIFGRIFMLNVVEKLDNN